MFMFGCHLRQALSLTLLMGCSLLLVSCSQPTGGSGASETGGNANGNSAGSSDPTQARSSKLAEHRGTIIAITDEMFNVLVLVQQRRVTVASGASEEQKEAFKSAADGFRISELKSELIAYEIWMDDLDSGQANELAAKMRDLDAWISEMKALAPVTTGPSAQDLQARLQTIDQLSRALSSDLAAL